MYRNDRIVFASTFFHFFDTRMVLLNLTQSELSHTLFHESFVESFVINLCKKSLFSPTGHIIYCLFASVSQKLPIFAADFSIVSHPS